MTSRVDRSRGREASTTTPNIQTTLHSFLMPTTSTGSIDNPYTTRQNSHTQPANPIPTRQTQIHDYTAPTTDNFAYGDSITHKHHDSFRAFGGNINGLCPDQSFSTTADIGLKIYAYHVDAICLIETNVNFNYKSAHHIIRRRLSPAWNRHLNFIYSNSGRTFEHYYQPGGMCQGVGGAWTHRVVSSLADESALGQWTLQTLRGKNNKFFTLITAYQVCVGTDQLGEKTTWKQRQSLLTEQNPNCDEAPDPRKHFALALTQLCQRLRLANHGILLFIDANSDLINHQSWLQTFVSSTNMSDIFTYRHGCDLEFATYKRGSTRIDYMLATDDLLPYLTACGYLEFDSDSDHRSMFADFKIADYLQELPPHDPHTTQDRIIHSRYKKQSRIFKASVLEGLTSHKYAQRLHSLWARVQDQDRSLSEEDIKELEAIDSLITQSMLNAEQEQFRAHNTPWSPYLIAFIHTLAYWAAWSSELRTSKDLSQQRAFRLAQVTRAGKTIADATEIPPSLDTARQHRRQSRIDLEQAMKRARELREEWLLDQEDLATTAGDKQRARTLRNIRKSEIIRQTHTTVKMTLSGRTGGALASLIYTDDTGIKHTTFNPSVITEQLIARNLKHFHQAEGTAFTNSDIQQICKKPLAQAIPELQSRTGNGNDAFDSIIGHLATQTLPEDPSVSIVTGSDLSDKFGRWREATSTSPSKRHLGLYRAIKKATNPIIETDDDTISSDPEEPPPDHGAIFFQCLAMIINICVATGYVLNRWRTIVSVMLEKIPSLPLIDKLRVIHLFEADFNAWAGIVFGRRMMRQAELSGALGEEQGGSRKGRSAVNVYAMKFLTFQNAELTRTSLAVMDNDAKACYDRIVMALATKRCEALGVPHDACILFENFLDTANYHISTQLGTSEQSYTSSPTWKLHGPGQGNQSSPAIWAAVSTLILNTMKTKFQGTSFYDPQQQLCIKHHMQAFVDDSSIWVNNFLDDINGIAKDDDLLEELQTATAWWEQLLTTTGGKLELSKCFFYFLQWRFRSDGAPYLLEEAPTQTITIQSSIDDDVATISHKNSYESHRTLGFQARPINDYKDQYAQLRLKSQKVIRALHAQKLDASTALNAYHSVFVPRIGYVFPFCGLTERQLNHIQAGPLAYTLQAMGYPKTFPRAMVFLSRDLGGLGFNKLYTEQGMANVQFILRHIRQHSDLGTFLRITFRWMQLTAGTGFPILESTATPIPYLTSKWITQLRHFLSTIKGSIMLPDEPPPMLQRDHDQFIMDIAIQSGYTPKTLSRINRVRLFLQVERLSDIATIEGKHLAHLANSTPHPTTMPSQSSNLWPKQNDPGPTSWRAWKQLMTTLTHDNHKLRQPQGTWRKLDVSRQWKALFDPDEAALYIATTSGWRVYIHPTYDSKGISISDSHHDTQTSCPPQAIPVAPSSRRRYDFDIPSFDIPIPPVIPARTWEQFRLELPTWEKDLLRFTHEVPASERLLQFLFIPDRTLHLVSDGGCKHSCGSFGWVLASENDILWKGWGTARGTPMSSYRAEAYGRLSSIRFLVRYMEYLQIPLRDDLSIRTWCDNEGLLTSEQAWRNIQIPNPYDHLQADADAIALTTSTYINLHHTAQHTHVKGHQDDHSETVSLPWPAQLNIAADALATQALPLSYRESREPPIPLACSAYLILQNTMITSKYKTLMHRAAGQETGCQYLATKLNLSITQIGDIDWDAHRRARATLPIRTQAFVTKQLCDWLPTNSKKARENPAIDNNCTICKDQEETIAHYLRCPALHHWRHRFLHDLADKLNELKTPDELHHHIFDSVRQWVTTRTLDEAPLLWLKGCIPTEWGEFMDRAYHAQGLATRTITGLSWSRQLCQYFMKATHTAWCIRSSLVSDEALSAHDSQTRHRLRQEITALYELQPQCILQYPFSVPLDNRLRHNNDHLSAWLANHKANILRSHTRWKEIRVARRQLDIRTFFTNIGHRT